MHREALRLAREEQRVVVMIEPIALYPMRDLHDEGDGLWMRHYPAAGETAPLGELSVDGAGTDLAIVTYGNGVYLSHQARKVLEQQDVNTRIVDLRWLAPLPGDALIQATRDCAHVLIIDECRNTGSQSEALMALFAEAGRTGIARETAIGLLHRNRARLWRDAAQP